MDRNENTLTNIIETHVEKGTVLRDNLNYKTSVHTDGWSSYGNLNEMGYEHWAVIHKHGFQDKYKNVRTGEERVVDTNKIEGAWSHVKKHFRTKNGVMRTTFESHLCEIMWRSQFGGTFDCIPIFFYHLREIFPLIQKPLYLYPIPIFASFIPKPYLSSKSIISVTKDHQSKDPVVQSPKFPSHLGIMAEATNQQVAPEPVEIDLAPVNASSVAGPSSAPEAVTPAAATTSSEPKRVKSKLGLKTVSRFVYTETPIKSHITPSASIPGPSTSATTTGPSASATTTSPSAITPCPSARRKSGRPSSTTSAKTTASGKRKTTSTRDKAAKKRVRFADPELEPATKKNHLYCPRGNMHIKKAPFEKDHPDSEDEFRNL